MTPCRLERTGHAEAGPDGALQVRFGVDPAGCCGRCPMRAGSARIGAMSLHGLAAAPLCAGDAVALSISEPGLARAAAWTFGAPLVGLAGGAWIGAIAGGDGSSVLCGLAGLAVALGWVVRSGDRLLGVLDLRVQVGGAAPTRLPADAGARRTLPGNGQINEMKEERS